MHVGRLSPTVWKSSGRSGRMYSSRVCSHHILRISIALQTQEIEPDDCSPQHLVDLSCVWLLCASASSLQLGWSDPDCCWIPRALGGAERGVPVDACMKRPSGSSRASSEKKVIDKMRTSIRLVRPRIPDQKLEIVIEYNKYRVLDRSKQS